MQAAQDYEQQSLTTWAYREFEQLMTGFRNELDPILPRPEGMLSILDFEISSFIARWQAEQVRIQTLLDQISSPEPEAPQPMPDQTMVSQAETITIPSVYVAMVDPDYIPEVGVLTDEGFLLDIDTAKGLDVPDFTIDPRDGGTYETEVGLVQPVFDIAQLVQDQVPAPIQSAANTIYDKITGSEGQ